MILVLSARHVSCLMVKRHLAPKDAERMMGGRVERVQARNQSNTVSRRPPVLYENTPLSAPPTFKPRPPEPCAYLIG